MAYFDEIIKKQIFEALVKLLKLRHLLSKNYTVANVLMSWLILTKKNLFRLPTGEDARKTAFNQGWQGWQDSSQVTMTEMIVILEV